MTEVLSTFAAGGPAKGSNAEPDIALCLSGGGYRAAIFHLGAVRWLNEIGWLPRIGIVSSVSGGSILAGHLAWRFREGWPAGRVADDVWRERIEEPFWRVVCHDVRTWPVMCRLVYWLPGLSWLCEKVCQKGTVPFSLTRKLGQCPSLTRNVGQKGTVPFSLTRKSGQSPALTRKLGQSPWLAPAEVLRREYVAHLLEGNDLPLGELIESPRFVFCATDMTFGVNWEARRDRVGDYMAGYARPAETEWTLARAIAASSCFPPIFPPSRPGVPPGLFRHGQYRKPDRREKLAGIRLTDGGVYDNLGLQPAMRAKKLLVSNGGGLFRFSLVEGAIGELVRYSDLLQNGVGKLRKQWIMRDFRGDPPAKEGAYWGIGDGVVGGPPLCNQETAEQIAAIRTDLNAFTRAEFEILVNHGYLLAAANIIRFASGMLDGPIDMGSVRPPYPQWRKTARRKRALRRSGSRWWPRWLR
jgi:NTE family protein